jgi:hypothetical protein
MNHKPTLVLTKDTLKLTYEATIREIAELEARLEKLRELRRVSEGILQSISPSESRVLEIPRGMIKPRGRAPHGALKAAVLGLFSPGEVFSNADIRERLVAAAYPYAIENMNLRKTLDRLAEAGEIQAQHKEGRVYFTKPTDKTKRS